MLLNILKNFQERGYYQELKKYCSSNDLPVWKVNSEAKSKYNLGITLGPNFSNMIKGEKEKGQELNKIEKHTNKIKGIVNEIAKSKNLESCMGGPVWGAGGVLMLYIGFKQDIVNLRG